MSDALDDILIRWEELRESGERTTPEELCRDHPDLTEEVRRRVRALDAIHRLRDPGNDTPTIPFGPNDESPRPRLVEAPQVLGYEIESELGRGGMGVVYKARRLGLNRIVALKMILSGAHAGAAELARFRREAEVVARLQHPNIVQIYEVGEQGGRPFLCLEYVDGVSLDRVTKGKPQSSGDAARLVRTLAEAVQYAHDRGVIHRDLKPGNVLIAARGLAPDAKPQAAPKISDFGLAKRLDDVGQTTTGTVMGTPSYMAPEQAEGKSDVGPSADVYALGAILYEMLSGRPPFHGPTLIETLEQVKSVEAVPPSSRQPGVPRDLESICLKCLRKGPAQRYGSARDLADDLGRFLEGQPIQARSETVLDRVGRALSRSRHADEFRPWVRRLMLMAPLPFAAQLGVWLLAPAEWYGLAALLTSLVVINLCAGAFLIAEPYRGGRGAAALPAWAMQFGHYVGCLIAPLLLWLMPHPFEPLLVFPIWLLLSGTMQLSLAGVYWGGFYLIGVSHIAAALLAAWWPETGPLLGSLLVSVGIFIQIRPLRDGESR